MRDPDIHYKKLVLVCTNRRTDNLTCCAKQGGDDLYTSLKQQVKQTFPDIRVSRTGCLGNCLSGPIVVVMPDNKWFGEVTMEDIPEILALLK